MSVSGPNRKRSWAWNHFTEVDPKKAKCNSCANTLSICNGNVGNLRRRLKSNHPTVPMAPERQPSPIRRPETPIENHGTREVTDVTVSIPQSQSGPANPRAPSSQPSIQHFAVSTKPLPPKRAEKIDEQLIKMIAKGHYPFSLVEDPEFQKFILMLCQQYKLPTRKTVSESLVPRLYNACLEQVKAKITQSKAICITTDGWTSINNDSFMAVTAHYIADTSGTAELRSNLLACVEYNERHTSENLTGFLKDVFAEWDISYKTTAIASDNASNISTAIRNGEWRQIPCLAHSLNLCVQNALAHISPTIIKVKAIVEHFKRSSQAQKKFTEMQKQLQLKQLKLKQDCPTRWNSTYDMLQRLIISKDAVIATLALISSNLALSIEDWKVVEETLPILELYNDVTVEISAEKNVNLAKVIPLVLMTKHTLNMQMKYGDTVSPQVHWMLITLKQEAEKRFSYVEKHVLYCEATILVPRFKSKGFSDQQNFERALAGLKTKVGLSSPTPAALTIVASATSVPQTQATSIWEDFDNEVARLIPENPIAAGIEE